jgi:hypothetical protein
MIKQFLVKINESQKANPFTIRGLAFPLDDVIKE